MVDSREALTPEGRRVVFAGVRMMCQSVKTVQHLEKGVTSGVEISDVFLTVIWWTAKESGLYLEGKPVLA